MIQVCGKGLGYIRSNEKGQFDKAQGRENGSDM
jgi:hypothetical protein